MSIQFKIWIFSLVFGTVSSFTYFAFSSRFWVFSPFSSGFWWISGKLLLSTDHWRRTDLSVNCRLHWYHPKEGTVLTSWHVAKKPMHNLKYVQTAVFLSWSQCCILCFDVLYFYLQVRHCFRKNQGYLLHL